MTDLKAPFPWFGGKSRVAHLVWERFGDVKNYVEPFFGSGAVLLGRPSETSQTRIETVNDLDGYVANFWRAIAAKPDEVARWADNPVNENDLHARHTWLVGQKGTLRSRLEGDPDFCDPKIAGWWVWGICCWIGGRFCAGEGPWRSVDGLFIKDKQGEGVCRQLPHLGDAGNGVNRGVDICEWFAALSARMSRVRVASGDWSRVCGPSPTTKLGLTGVFLDPPYSAEAGRDMNCYLEDSGTVAHDVRRWAIEHGDDPKMRIALCGYEGEHTMPNTWECVAWKAKGGYGSQSTKHNNPNAGRERIWFSPHCLKPGGLL